MKTEQKGPIMGRLNRDPDLLRWVNSWDEARYQALHPDAIPLRGLGARTGVNAEDTETGIPMPANEVI